MRSCVILLQYPTVIRKTEVYDQLQMITMVSFVAVTIQFCWYMDIWIQSMPCRQIPHHSGITINLHAALLTTGILGLVLFMSSAQNNLTRPGQMFPLLVWIIINNLCQSWPTSSFGWSLCFTWWIVMPWFWYSQYIHEILDLRIIKVPTTSFQHPFLTLITHTALPWACKQQSFRMIGPPVDDGNRVRPYNIILQQWHHESFSYIEASHNF